MNNYDQAAQWLQEHIGQQLEIVKSEKAIGSNMITDHDKVKIVVDKVSTRESDYKDLDGYVAARELILHGQGQIYTKEGLFPLPQSAFEIPLTGAVRAIATDHSLEIDTEATHYSFIPR